MKTLDLTIRIISWMTIAALIAIICVKRLWGIGIPAAVSDWCIPVFTAAAVGYLTNWIAIWLLFKPYGKHCGIVQGVIPRNKAKLGHELGVLIPEYLLNPDELAGELGTLVDETLHNPRLLTDIRSKVNLFLKKYGDSVASFLLPHVMESLRMALEENLSPEKLNLLYENIVVKWLENEQNKDQLVQTIVSELKSRVPAFTDSLRENLKDESREYVREEYPLLSEWFAGDALAPKGIDLLNWERIRNRLYSRLDEKQIREKIAAELTLLTGNLQTWLRSPEAGEKLQRFVREHREEMEDYVKSYLTAYIPRMANTWLKKDDFREAVEHRLLPLIQAFLRHRLRREKETLIRKMDISGRIENSVAQMDMKKLHHLLLRASDNNLTVIQLLGYFLGMIAGFLQIFAEPF